MQPAATSLQRSALDHSTSPWQAWLQRLRYAFSQDDDTRFLCEAADLADLEGRLRCLEQGRADRFGQLPLVL